ncbi:MAG: hypothetical protein ACM3WV_03470 [Bacillota bacterium]
MKKVFLWVCIGLCIMLTGQAWAASGEQAGQNIQGVQEIFSSLESAFEAENVNGIINCFAEVVPSTDVPRGLFLIYTQAQMREEYDMTFPLVEDVRVDFLNLQIICDRDTAMAKTLRRIEARALIPGFPPVIYAEMVYTLQKTNHGWGNQNWKIVNQVLTDEWYEFGEVSGMEVAQSKQSRKKSRPLFWF